MLWSSFSILGLVGIFVVIPIDNVLCVTTSDSFIGFAAPIISVSRIWQLLGSIVFITIVDLTCRQRLKKE
nr:MAG TPA: hypothetical protein [Caudoviricetes sp.]